MAYRSRSGGASRGSSYRTAPSTNAAAYAFAVVALVVVVVIFVVATGGKEDAPPPEPTVPVSTAPVAAPPKAPVKKAEAPYPKIDDALITKARALVKTFEGPASEGNRLYDEGMRAKQAGNDAIWQSKMEEAMPHFQSIQDGWNELIGQMPRSQDYDEEEVANHYLGAEGKRVSGYLVRLEAIRKTMRLR